MKSENITAIAAVVMSIAALGVAIWQGMLSREYNRLSLRPYLQVSPELVGGGDSKLIVDNEGTGAAYIQAVSISARGKSFNLAKNGWHGFFTHIGVNSDCFRHALLKPKSAVSPGRKIPIAEITRASGMECDISAALFLTEPDMRLIIEYRSAFKERFVYSEIISLTDEQLGPSADLIKQLRHAGK